MQYGVFDMKWLRVEMHGVGEGLHRCVKLDEYVAPDETAKLRTMDTVTDITSATLY